MNESLSLSLSLFFKTNFILFFWTVMAEALTLLIFCLFFDFLNLALSYLLVLVCVGVGEILIVF